MKTNFPMLRGMICVVAATTGGCLLPASPAAELPQAKGAYVATGSMSSPLAHQAAAADEKFVYAINDDVIAKYDRATGKELARSKGKAQHLNSGFLWEGKLYCAHSNYPDKPHLSDIRVLDPATMSLKVFHIFDDPPGSLTWAVRRDGDWWCHFAHYGKDNGKSVLVRFGDSWQEIGPVDLPGGTGRGLGQLQPVRRYLAAGRPVGHRARQEGDLPTAGSEGWKSRRGGRGRPVAFPWPGDRSGPEDRRAGRHRPRQEGSAVRPLPGSVEPVRPCLAGNSIGEMMSWEGRGPPDAEPERRLSPSSGPVERGNEDTRVAWRRSSGVEVGGDRKSSGRVEIGDAPQRLEGDPSLSDKSPSSRRPKRSGKVCPPGKLLGLGQHLQLLPWPEQRFGQEQQHERVDARLVRQGGCGTAVMPPTGTGSATFLSCRRRNTPIMPRG